MPDGSGFVVLPDITFFREGSDPNGGFPFFFRVEDEMRIGIQSGQNTWFIDRPADGPPVRFHPIGSGHPGINRFTVRSQHLLQNSVVVIGINAVGPLIHADDVFRVGPGREMRAEVVLCKQDSTLMEMSVNRPVLRNLLFVMSPVVSFIDKSETADGIGQ